MNLGKHQVSCLDLHLLPLAQSRRFPSHLNCLPEYTHRCNHKTWSDGRKSVQREHQVHKKCATHTLTNLENTLQLVSQNRAFLVFLNLSRQLGGAFCTTHARANTPPAHESEKVRGHSRLRAQSEVILRKLVVCSHKNGGRNCCMHFNWRPGARPRVGKESMQ